MSYTVHFEPSGHQIEVSDSEHILTAALRHGLQIPYSCRGGACGACKAQIIEGEVDYPEGDPARPERPGTIHWYDPAMLGRPP